MPIQAPLRLNVDPLPEDDIRQGVQDTAAAVAARVTGDSTFQVGIRNITEGLIGSESFILLIAEEITNRVNEDVTLAVRLSVVEILNEPVIRDQYYAFLQAAILAALNAISPAP